MASRTRSVTESKYIRIRRYARPEQTQTFDGRKLSRFIDALTLPLLLSATKRFEFRVSSFEHNALLYSPLPVILPLHSSFVHTFRVCPGIYVERWLGAIVPSNDFYLLNRPFLLYANERNVVCTN